MFTLLETSANSSSLITTRSTSTLVLGELLLDVGGTEPAIMSVAADRVDVPLNTAEREETGGDTGDDPVVPLRKVSLHLPAPQFR